MNIDPVTGAVILFGLRTVGKPAAEVLTSLVERFLGPSVDIGGEALRDFLRNRIHRGESILKDAVEMLAASGQEPQPVPGRILLPILEHGSLEEDDTLRLRWSALLANAAAAGSGSRILPGYTDILQQLTPVHVQILGRAFENASVESGMRRFPAIRAEEVAAHFGVSSDEALLLAADLHRLCLVDSARSVRMFMDDYGHASPINYRSVELTILGVAFIEACQPPKSG